MTDAHLLEALHIIDDDDLDEVDLDELRATYVPAALANLLELYTVSTSTYHDVIAAEPSPAVLRLVLAEAVRTLTDPTTRRPAHHARRP